MSVLERIAEMEKRLLGAWHCRMIKANDNEVRASLHAFSMRVAQDAAVVFAAEMMGEGTEAFAAFLEMKAMERFPLPPKRVLREEPDPHRPWRWRYASGRMEVNMCVAGHGGWGEIVEYAGAEPIAPTPERIDLWHSLKHEPYREVPDNGEG